MPNEAALDRTHLTLRMSVELLRRVEKLAKQLGVTRNEAIEKALKDATRYVELSPEDYKWITDQVQKNLNKRSAARTTRGKGNA